MNDAFRIKRTMNRMGVSQGKLAKLTGISQPTLSRIVSGARVPKVAELSLIASALSTPMSYFLLPAELPAGTQVAARSTDSAQMAELLDAVSVYVDMDRFLSTLGY